jgi:hypothetical protein
MIKPRDRHVQAARTTRSPKNMMFCICELSRRNRDSQLANRQAEVWCEDGSRWHPALCELKRMSSNVERGFPWEVGSTSGIPLTTDEGWLGLRTLLKDRACLGENSIRETMVDFPKTGSGDIRDERIEVGHQASRKHAIQCQQNVYSNSGIQGIIEIYAWATGGN